MATLPSWLSILPGFADSHCLSDYPVQSATLPLWLYLLQLALLILIVLLTSCLIGYSVSLVLSTSAGFADSYGLSDYPVHLAILSLWLHLALLTHMVLLTSCPLG